MYDACRRNVRPSLLSIALLTLAAASCQGQSPPADPKTEPSPTSAAAPASASAAAAAAVSASASASDSAPAPAPASFTAPRALWSVQTQGKTASIVDVVGDRVYALAGEYLEAGSPTRWVMALDAPSGRVVWSKDMGKTIFSEAFVADGLVVLSSTEGKRTVLDATTGAPSTKKAPKEAPKPEASALDCAHAGGQFACGEKASSEKKWQAAVAEPVSKITQPPGRVCFARARMLSIECRDAKTGAIVWIHTVPPVPNVKEPDAVHFDYRVVEGRLYVANYDGTVAALEVPK